MNINVTNYYDIQKSGGKGGWGGGGGQKSCLVVLEAYLLKN